MSDDTSNDDLRDYFEVCGNVFGNLNRAIKAITEQRETMNTETDYLIFVVESWGKTPIMAATDFAAEHFAERRQIEGFDPATSTFRLVDGTATYRVVEQAAVPGVSRATFGIYRLASDKES